MAVIEQLAAQFGLPLPTAETRQRWLRLLEPLEQPPPHADRWLSLEPSHIAVRVQLAQRAAALADRLKALRAALGERVEAWLALPAEELLAQMRQPSDWRWWRSPSSRAVRRIRSAVGRRASRREIIERLQQAREAQSLMAWFATHEATLSERLDAASPLDADWTAICAALEWVERLHVAWPEPLPSER